MANLNAPFGAQVVGNLVTAPYNAKTRQYLVPSNSTSAIFEGDFVKLSGDSDPVSGIAYVEQAAPGDTGIIGVAVSDQFNPLDLEQMYTPAATAGTQYVMVDPYITIQIQATGAAYTSTMVGQNADIAVGTGNTVSGSSGMSIDLTTVGAGTAQLRILGLSQLPNNTIGDYSILDCLINEHAFKGTAGV